MFRNKTTNVKANVEKDEFTFSIRQLLSKDITVKCSLVLLSIFLTSLLLLSFTISLISEDSQRGLQVRKELEIDSGKPVGTYRALIIGINDYKDDRIDDLNTPVNDARSIADILKGDYGFKDVKLLINDQANGSAIERELRRLATQSSENGSPYGVDKNSCSDKAVRAVRNLP